MKGKFKIICAILFLAVAITAGVFINLKPKNEIEWVQAAQVGDGTGEREFSFVDENGIIMSVEKVAVKTSPNPSEADFKTPLYNSAFLTDSTKKMLIKESSGGEAYYYVDIANEETENENNIKYVVHNHEYVKLNNLRSENGGNEFYYTNLKQDIYDASSKVYMAEAIAVSLGQYFQYTKDGDPTPVDCVGLAGQEEYTYGGVTTRKENSGAQLSYIQVEAYRNGQRVELPGLRDYGSGYKDFVWIIPQKEGYQGYYQLNFYYMYNNRPLTINFDFYLLFDSDYEGEVSDGNGEYNLQPTLINTDGFENGANRYYLGKSEATLNNYPTLSFDYTRYAFSYSHIANGKTIDYRYDFSTNGNESSTTAMYNCYVNGSQQPVSYPLGNYIKQGSNIVVFVFTEVGEYSFNFEYIYSGYGESSAPAMNLPIEGTKLTIHGFELNYSATISAKAQMRHLTLAKLKPTNQYRNRINVGLIVPNGYEYGKMTDNENLGVVYSLHEQNSADESYAKPVGSLYSIESADRIGWNNVIASERVEPKQYLEQDFVKTNQGAILLSTNDAYGQNEGSKSVYYYSPNKADLETAAQKAYTNQTSFNQIGYYLVFVRVEIDSLPDHETKFDYYQVFAFEYTADTTNVQVNEVDAEGNVGEVVGSDGYTNKNVRIHWEIPGIFERKITVKYYTVLGEYYSKEELLKTAGVEIQKDAVLGSEIDRITTGSKGAKYLIEVVCENKSAVYRTFTIDRDPITGIKPYLVERTTNLVGNIVYRFARSTNGSFISLENDIITDSVATLFWDNKKSGAEISATYSLTPFVLNEQSISEINYSNNTGIWHTTNYSLSDTIEDLQFSRATELGAGLDKQKILTTQGLYLFTLTDKAGNSVKYLFVIDQTPAYFKIEEKDTITGEYINPQFYTGESLLFTNDIRITLGTHKAIKFNEIANETLNSFVEDITNLSPSNQLDANNYYSRNNVYLSNLRSLFVEFNDSYYLTVQNRYLYVYNDTKASVQTLNLQQSRTLSLSHGEGASTVRIIYLVGRNQTYLKDLSSLDASQNYSKISSSNSYLMVEINTDHSLGMAFYANSADVLRPDSISENGMPQQGLTRLFYTGSTGKEFEGTHATSEAYLAFTWLIGKGTGYEIGKVSYKYYELDLSGLVENDKANFGKDTGYFYLTNKPNVEQILYSENKYGAGVVNNGTRAMVVLNIENSQTKPGLYVLTREYLEDITAEGETDSNILSYYFIVDRNEIIASGVSGLNINGGSISVGLKDNEYKFYEFNTITSSVPYTLKYFNDATKEDADVQYNIYMETNRLPAVLNIPVGKYFYEENGTGYGSEYYAGKLNFSVYFKDYYGQLPNDDVVKLFESNVNGRDTDYYQLDFSSLISNELKSRFIFTDKSTGISNEKYWLCLPGDYVVVVSDNVEGTTHQKVIGFRIYGNENSSPTTNIYATYNKETESNEIASSETKLLVTNEEFVVLDLFNNTSLPQNLTKAQLDLDYLLVEQIYEGVSSTYIEYKHTSINGHNIDSSQDISYILRETDEFGTVRRKILLDTLLNRNADGSINLADIYKSLTYKVTIRYNISGANIEDIDKYKNCYYYFDGDQVYTCYESVYTIVIDRVPPKENIQALENSDRLIEFYKNGEETLFEVKDYSTANSLEFVERYKNYYQTLDNADIYALYVNGNTPFNADDVSEVRYRPIINPKSFELNWPIILEDSNYNTPYLPSNNPTYSALGLSVGFYEILEIDAAGNISQYVIFYDDGESNYDNLNFNVNANVYSDGDIRTERQTLSISNDEQETLTIFDIFALEEGNSFEYYSDLFYRFELNNSNGQPFSPAHAINTNFATGFDAEFATNIINNVIKAEGPGNYNLVLRSRTNTKVYNLNYYSDVKTLNVNDIIVDQGEGESYEFLYLNLAGANITENGITYYAKEIHRIQGSTEVVYYCDTNNFNYYYLVEGDSGAQRVYVPDNRIYKESLSGTYELVMIDVFGNESSTSFNTEDGRLHYIRFGAENESGNFFEQDNVYYTYNQARVIFENSLYTVQVSYSVNNGTWTSVALTSSISWGGQTIIELVNIGQGKSQVVVYPYFSQDKLSGATIHVNVLINGVNGGRYDIVVDTNIGTVSLRDINSQESTLKADVNADPQTTTHLDSYAGIMNLIWGLPSKNFEPYKYKFSLQETMLNGSVETIEFEDGVFSHIINTSQESSGIYRFVVEIYTNNEAALYLGNKVYTFSVQTSADDLFYVSLSGNRIIQPNSQFTFEEIETVLRPNSQAIRDSLNVVYNDLISDPYEYSLYIVSVNEINTNSPSTAVHTAEGTNLEKRSWSITWAGNKYAFYIYRLYTSTYSFYLGILEVENTNDLVYNLQVNEENLNTSLNLSYYYSDDVDYTLRGIRNITNGITTNPVINKNVILISVYCNNEFIEKFETSSIAGGEFEYLIRGNGQYSFEFSDLAGNTHMFTVTSNFSTTQSPRLNVYILREIVLLVNGANAVENAYYNNTVEIGLLNPALYDTGTISLFSCTLNGVEYQPEIDSFNQIYRFSGYGSYRVEFHAYYKEQLLKKVLVFTIVNVNEASNSFDLSNIFKYRVDTILNNAGQDITNELLNAIYANEGKNQYLLTYQMLLDNPNLGTSYGKQIITIIYTVDDGIYPVRELRFSFTLNDQVPTIKCNVKAGDKTTKGFKITYNPGVIYQQVGESNLYINDTLVAAITADSPDATQTYSVSFKKNGAGDYYVVLSGTSGAVHTGFVVTVKEPLNASSIIIIVVVVVIVAAVIGIIIFLRTKMKIR